MSQPQNVLGSEFIRLHDTMMIRADISHPVGEAKNEEEEGEPGKNKSGNRQYKLFN